MKILAKISVIIIGVVVLYYIAWLFWCEWYPLLYTNENKTEMILFWIGFGASFMALVLVKDQEDRLKNSTFGGLIGTGLSALVTIIQKPVNVDNIIYSVFGSILGTFFAWLIYAGIAVMAYIKYDNLLPLVELIKNGVAGIEERIISFDNGILLKNLDIWWRQFATDFEEKSEILLNMKRPYHAETVKAMVESIVKSLLASVCKIHNLMYSSIQMRASIIRFDENQRNGKHWIYFAEPLNPYNLKTFDPTRHGKEPEKESEAHKLLMDEFKTTAYIDTEKDTDIQNRDSKDRYRYFSLFKIDKHHILTVDWPNDINKTNMEITSRYFPRITTTLHNLFAKFDSELKESNNK